MNNKPYTIVKELNPNTRPLWELKGYLTANGVVTKDKDRLHYGTVRYRRWDTAWCVELVFDNAVVIANSRSAAIDGAIDLWNGVAR